MLNKMILQGRLVAAPELRMTQSEIPCLNFTVAWSETYKETKRECFQDCRAWRGTAEFIARNFKKGEPILVSGRMLTQRWVDKQGMKHSVQICEIETVDFCGGNRSASESAQTPAPAVAPVAAGMSGYGAAELPQFEVIGADDELPF